MFPPGFLFGTATSATQVEGGCRDTDWYDFAGEPGRIKGGDTPAVACDQWSRWREDVALQARLGMNAHRLSIEWARVEPRPGEIDRAALDHYRALIGALRDAGVEPMVTLHHFSLPRWMAAAGGLLGGDLPERLARYTGQVVAAPEGAEVSDLGWEIFPEGLGALVREWAARSGLPVYVTENGIADAADRKRAKFLVDHLAELDAAIAAGVDVRGYLHWSLLDNFEWAEGYAPRFGLVAVDYATQARTVRPSGELYARIARERALPAQFGEKAIG